jgi:hypothetical protein
MGSILIRGGDSAGMFEKLYSGHLSTCSTLNQIPERLHFLVMAMGPHKILTIRPWSGLIDLIKLWKHPCRIIYLKGQPPRFRQALLEITPSPGI